MEDFKNKFLGLWNDPAYRTLIIIMMVLPIALIVVFKLKVFGLNKVVRRARTRATRYSSRRRKTYRK